MAAKNFYDAVLLGLGLPTLLAGALLAKRGFRVLLVGQGQPLPSYRAGDFLLPRGASTLYAADSPAVTRIFSELALRPLMRRRLRPLSPAFQAIMPHHRIDLSSAPELVTREVEREFPAVRRAADDFIRGTHRSWDRLNPLMATDLVWPPGGFFERRALSRACRDQPFGSDDGGAQLSDLAEDHPFRAIMSAALRFSDGSTLGTGNPQRELRQISGLLHSAALLEGGQLGLWQLLMDSIRTHNGDVRVDSRIDRISVRRGAAESVRLSPSDEEVGCHFVLSGLSVVRAARLLSDRSGLDALLDARGAPSPRALRYTLNVVVASEAIPEGLARNVLLLSSARAQLGEGTLRIETDVLTSEHSLISAEALLPVLSPEAEAESLATLRERILARLADLSPFLREHVVLVDSPHDGRPVFDAVAAQYIEPPEPHRRGPATMSTVYAYPHTELHGCTALPVRTPVKRLLLCNDQVVPGLSNEGLFLTAWSGARIVARTLGRQWMNRGRWTKVDL